MSDATVFSDVACTLGEGPLWHPERSSLFWFDILRHRLYEHDGESLRHWTFDRAVSAAGWVDRDTLLVASARDLFRFDLRSGTEKTLVALEADTPGTRSNDGRADPQGGFWIGTMGFEAEPGAGAIYRYYGGELRLLFPDITISNAICFAPGGGHAYFTDTPTRIIRRVALDADGWPVGAVEDWLDLDPDELNPDGAVIDADGRFWNAQWGAGRVACYDASGVLERVVRLPAAQTTCPAFGGPGRNRLFVTSAAEGTGPEDRHAGMTFCADLDGVRGQDEHRVIL